MNFKKISKFYFWNRKPKIWKGLHWKSLLKLQLTVKYFFSCHTAWKIRFFGAVCNIFSIRSVRDLIHSVRDLFPFSFDGRSSLGKKGKCQTFLFIRQSIDVWWLLIRMRAFAFLFSIGGGSKVEVWFSYVALIRTWLNSNRAVIQ